MSVTHPRRDLAAGAPTRTHSLVSLGRALQLVALGSATVWLVLAVAWSDHGEGAGYATPIAVLAAAASILIGAALRRLLGGGRGD